MSKAKRNTVPPAPRVASMRAAEPSPPHRHGLAAPRKPIETGSDRLRDALGLPADSAIEDVCEEAAQRILGM